MSAGLIKIYSITSGDFITPRLGPTYGPIVGGVVGSVVGFFFGQPGLGYAIGSTLGGLLNPVSPENQEVFGPRLSDLTTQISTYGAVIPRLYGTVGVSGNIIWIENNALKETITRSKSGGSGGKGGGRQEVGNDDGQLFIQRNVRRWAVPGSHCRRAPHLDQRQSDLRRRFVRSRDDCRQ
jgi:hypothetical protein